MRSDVVFDADGVALEYEPGQYMERIAPTPLLVITADSDTLTPTGEILAAYERAAELKRMLQLPGGHYDLYGSGRARATAVARDWFVEHLITSQRRRVPKPERVDHGRDRRCGGIASGGPIFQKEMI
jgi:hypothetical protein